MSKKDNQHSKLLKLLKPHVKDELDKRPVSENYPYYWNMFASTITTPISNVKEHFQHLMKVNYVHLILIPFVFWFIRLPEAFVKCLASIITSPYLIATQRSTDALNAIFSNFLLSLNAIVYPIFTMLSCIALNLINTPSRLLFTLSANDRKDNFQPISTIKVSRPIAQETNKINGDILEIEPTEMKTVSDKPLDSLPLDSTMHSNTM